ncbi:MAG: DUF5723 family protein [Dysgonamonadaceae bacterium]|jgi:hypothetical protein|nr:DUF5723 family protein [Dysgonamonadaceae bacterium]
MNTIPSFSKKIFFIVWGICFSFSIASGQSTYTEYFMRSSFTKMYLNPAKRPERGFIGIPGLTNIQVGYKTNTFGLDNFLFPGLGENGKSAWFMNENVSYDRFMQGISEQNYLNLDFAYTPVGFGFYIKDLYLTFDAGLKFNADLNIPGDFFKFLKKGIPLGEDGEGETYDFSDIGIGEDVYAETGIGASYPFLDKTLVLGAKVKLLWGMTSAQLNIDRMIFNAGKHSWTLSTLASAHIVGIPASYDDENKFDGLNSDDLSIGVNGFGVGFDLGATFTPKNTGLTFSAALTDIGSIEWDDRYVTYLATDPNDIVITGNHSISGDDIANSLSDIVDNLADDFAEAFALKEDPDAVRNKTTTELTTQLNVGLEYALLNNKMNVGVLSATHFNPMKTVTEFTFAGAYRPSGGVELGLSYSFMHSQFKTFGMALHLGPLYIAGDYIVPHFNSNFIPTTMRAFNIQFGFVVPI